MKTFKFQQIQKIYLECIVQAETLEEARQKAILASWDESEPELIKHQYKVVESGEDIYDDYDALMEQNWIDL